MKRRLAREKAFQSLFQIEVSDISVSDAMEHVLEEEPSDDFLIEIVNGTVEKKEEIERFLTPYLEKWSFSRLANVERVVLQMAAYEWLYMDEVPKNVTLNEAIETAKIFGGEEAGRFVNGVLGKIITDIRKK
ncbi:transcription antitermination factor NusB [Fictibacillus nanhaiensis]|jgi:transcription antitermination protein NusB|uniref:transcription antitermination factor NusB n=1 Tax=Fictibacillus nanhaiensis TaxID=742169 RepID=UPI00203DC440|nr:transcription antitermination factor NusB [Fictibacillus nanhaiensis]MCM3730638.1 transcription antitermination factor NusB [Fictibacillus nanhaiensis]